MTATVREHALSLWTITQLGMETFKGKFGNGTKLNDFLSLLAYGVEHPSRRRRVEMQVKAMVKTWVELIVGLSTAHTKDDLDRCEFGMEEHLSPLLTAPVAQIREFFAGLVVALEKDERVPFFVARMFDAYQEAILKKAPDGAVVELKKELAGEIAELVEKDIQADLRQALIGALQWRPPQALEKVRDAVRKGHKPRLRGRESCLFLCIPDPDDDKGGEIQVML